ncbi:hypothetical protein [Amphritea pacifica]|uniref:Sulfotransferase family protein n=1 Tax=Amphritea pacifica TaxID=2811233 RepID=A0ABS2WDR1_9GAMM|nr:hypothetical protein [Amphritea pacifica]MBN0989834.1 hypothetical protein [Amphritea pacifica]
MKEYDSNLPLVVIHVPKTAGVSVREIYKSWYSDGLLFHYYDAVKGAMPQKYDLAGMHSNERPVAVYGHFNKARGFGVEHYYPDAKQFVTILRDPFERAVSAYFYLRKQGREASRIPDGDLREYVLGPRVSILNQFPCEVTMDNYQEIIESLFIEVGVTEHLDESMARIANKIHKEYQPGTLLHLNATERDQSMIPADLKEEFMANKQLDYAIYNYVRAKYD